MVQVHKSNGSPKKGRKLSKFHIITIFLVTLQAALIVYFSLKRTYVVTLDYECQGFPLMTPEEEKNAPIPRIIHQTWKNNSVPSEWSHCVDSWSNNRWPDKNNYEHILWTDKMLLDFLTEHFPWFLPTYNNYRYPIQKIDAARLFLLYKYGGIYVDMDIKREDIGNHSVAEFRRFEVVFPKTDVGISNDFIMAAPGHPLIKQMIEDLPYADHWYYILPFLHVFMSGGPLFVSRHYKSFNPKDRIYILNGMCYNSGNYISHWPGSTWHRWDSRMLNKIWEQKYGLIYILLLILLGLLIVFFVLKGVYKLMRKFCFFRYSKSDNWVVNTL
eukprot:TRINITY_DN1003_c0_g1_i3.p1 TRINITY_DN1003_c0_g1~~TRINITY_DN1003_c0_g1_i3.p1  ORF type:complete len:328 (-),score=16.94 TRINITY_DN1003_c0_g1_i3:73-1056(-)